MSTWAGRSRQTAVCAACAGAGGLLTAKALTSRLLLLKLRRDVRALNAGEYRPLLAGYATDATIRFNDADHRWAGEHQGREAIERFLRNFVAAGLQGEIRELFISGMPWRLSLIARFDDHAQDREGREIYRNHTVLLARARWGRIVWQEDFYEDTERISALERRLTELGVDPAS